jgi:amino acid adenylation domain-containing protein
MTAKSWNTSQTNMSPAAPAESARPLGVPAAWTGADSLRPYPAARLDQLVARQAARTPGAPALHDGSTIVSYAELMQQARRLAHVLRARGIGRDDLVAVCIDRSIEQIVSVLGILLAGAAYVPIDPQGPTERRRFMLEDSRPRAIVTSAAFAESIPIELRGILLTLDTLSFDKGSFDKGSLDKESLDTAAHDAAAGDAPLPIGTPQDVAYVIYTSGSTGTPKGVLNQHDGVSNHLAWMADTFPLSTDDRVLGKTPAVFDVSVWEWFWPLSQGACLILTRPGGEKDPPYLLDAIESYGITNIQFVPTLLRLFLERPDLDRCRTLQRVVCSGEALTAELRDRFFERMPGPPALIDLYGPTESAVHVTGWVCTPGETGPVPIGRPLPNVRAYIVDEALNAVPEGVQGELLIGGVQVARGYLRRPELTRERFVPDPFLDDPSARCYRTGDCVSWRADGAIDFFGRYDSQVQLGGVRVELGEIEAALRLHPAVGDAAVLVRETEASKRLVAYLRRADVGGTEPDPSVDSLRRFLADTLADYMTPGWYVWLDEFPVTPTGKLDRRALPKPEGARPPIEQAFEPPQAGTEARLARIWCDVLQLDRVGRQDDFHLLGADSLSALRLFEAITQEFGIELPLVELLRSPTIALLASRLDAGEAHAPTTSIVTLRVGEGQQALYLPPSMGGELLYWRELVQALAPGRPVYGFALPADCEDPTDLHALAAALVRDLVAFQPEGPYHLAGYSFSAAVAFEMAQQLRASGRRVGVLAMIDYGPGLPDAWPGRLRTAGHFVANLPYWLRYDILQAGWGSVAARVRRKLTTVGDKIVHMGRPSPAQSAERAVDEMFDQQLPEAHRRLVIDQLDAYYRYQPVAYGGRILLFWARCRPLFHDLAPDLGWTLYAADGFQRVVVACNHDNILMLPHVGVIAAALDEALSACEPARAHTERRRKPTGTLTRTG